MVLKVISSSSAGNAYVLENDQEALLIECGVRFDRIKQALKFRLGKVVGCIVTHEHKDHCASVKEVLGAGIKVVASEGTMKAIGMEGHHRYHRIIPGKSCTLGGFEVRAFDVKHDCAEPLGFLIRHDECGTVLFLTDSYYVGYTFPGLNNIILEANYCHRILDERMATGVSPEFLRNRVISSHMSLATCKELLQVNDLSKVNNIVLIHLSDGNSDAERFEREVRELTGKTVTVADKGMEINFDKSPF